MRKGWSTKSVTLRMIHQVSHLKGEERMIHQVGHLKGEERMIHQVSHLKDEERMIHQVSHLKDEERMIHQVCHLKDEERMIHQVCHLKDEEMNDCWSQSHWCEVGVGGAFQPRIQPLTKRSWILTWPLPPFLDQFWVWSDQFLIEWHQKWHMPAQLHLVKQRIKNVQARNGSFNHTHSPCMWLFNVRKEPPRPSYKWIRIWMFWGAFFPFFFFSSGFLGCLGKFSKDRALPAD